MGEMLKTVALLFGAIARGEAANAEGLHAKLTNVEPGKAVLCLEIMPRATRFVVEGDTEGLINGEIVQFKLKDSNAVWDHRSLKITVVQFEP